MIIFIVFPVLKSLTVGILKSDNASFIQCKLCLALISASPLVLIPAECMLLSQTTAGN